MSRAMLLVLATAAHIWAFWGLSVVSSPLPVAATLPTPRPLRVALVAAPLSALQPAAPQAQAQANTVALPRLETTTAPMQSQPRAGSPSFGKALQAGLIAQTRRRIRDAIVGAWHQPPGFVHGFSAQVSMHVSVQGDIVEHHLTESSGNSRFDKSVLVAVGRVRQLPFISQLPLEIYTDHFQQVTLAFTPTRRTHL